ncbi:MAG TPA: aminotransferase class V-fold PLP-dependent enzyme [Gemmatimonadaceae bacterium]|nr:aminotransferase class V-fold PLP-dependent enzyme [Gemmatimonadaceae bacterium]
MTVSRRDFTRLLALTGSAAFLRDFPRGLIDSPLPATPAEPDEQFWKAVRSRFLMPPDLAFVNAANICPTSVPVLEALEKNTRLLDGNPSAASRAKLTEGREESRRLIAQTLRVTPEEVVITRNTSEANNFVSSGLHLSSGDEVVVFGDNHASNIVAWREKAKRFGFTVVEVPVVSPHPGPQAYADAFVKAMTPRTKVLAITHVTNIMGDVLPVAQLCGIARSRGILSLVDGAQSFGVLDVNLAEMRPDFYSGSIHKWTCGPKETGVLFINKEVHDRISPSVVSLYPGAVGISRTFEGFGQRDEAALATVSTAVKLQDDIGRATIERRSRQLAQRLMTELQKLSGGTLLTHPDAARSAAILVFKPGKLEPRKLVTTLYEKERIVVATSSDPNHVGVRFSPHFYNTMDEIDRTVAAIGKYMSAGLS